jgi:photosystem II stability/assembly factor-like uncharacterized protein
MKKLFYFIVLSITISANAQSWVSLNDNYLTQVQFNSVNFFDANTGYAVGINGTIAKTTDGGNTWSIIKSGGSELNSVACLGATDVVVAGHNGVIMRSTDGGSNWELINSGTVKILENIYFSSSSTGYIVGERGAILKSTDSGNTWAALTPPDTSNLFSSSFVNDNVGYISSGSKLLKTTDGGQHWDIKTTPGCYCVSFINADTGFAASGYVISMTTDGGDNWVTVSNNMSGDTYTSIVFTDNDHGYATDYSCGVYKTTDGGLHWTQASYLNGELFSMDMVNSEIGYIVGYRGVIFKTTDGGTYWTEQTRMIGDAYINSVLFTDDSTGYVLACDMMQKNYSIYKTTERGDSWSRTYFANRQMNSFFFTNKNTGYCVGAKGLLFKTSDGGDHWDSLSLAVASKCLNSIYFTDIDTGFAVGDSGLVIKTTDAGNSWTALNPGTSNRLTSVFFVTSDIGYAAGDYIILKTTDGGINWTTQNTQSVYYRSLFFTDQENGYLTGTNMSIFRTTDGGITWTYQTVNEMIYSIYFIDKENGIAVGSGCVMHTHDKGDTWNTDITNSAYFKSVCITPSLGVFVAGDNGTLLRNTEVLTGIQNYPAEKNNEVSVYPVPAIDNITIETPTSNIGTILSIFAADGRKIFEGKVFNNKIQIDIHEFPKGIYLVRLYDGLTMKTSKFIKK